MAAKPLPPTNLLRQLFRYEPETGKLFWLPRKPEFFVGDGKAREHSAARWNGRLAGKEAFARIGPDGYKRGPVLGRIVASHRVVWAMFNDDEPEMVVDHINGNRDDNRIENLRLVPMVENARNLCRRKDNKVGVTGIKYRDGGDSKKRWVAGIKVDGKCVHLGSYATKGEAINARKQGERKFGFHPNHGKPTKGYHRPVHRASNRAL